MNRFTAFFIILFFSSCTGNILYKKYSQIPGGKIYLAKCGACHQIRNIEKYSFDTWKKKIQEHEKRIQLNTEEREMITLLNQKVKMN